MNKALDKVLLVHHNIYETFGLEQAHILFLFEITLTVNNNSLLETHL